MRNVMHVISNPHRGETRPREAGESPPLASKHLNVILSKAKDLGLILV